MLVKSQVVEYEPEARLCSEWIDCTGARSLALSKHIRSVARNRGKPSSSGVFLVTSTQAAAESLREQPGLSPHISRKGGIDSGFSSRRRPASAGKQASNPACPWMLMWTVDGISVRPKPWRFSVVMDSSFISQCRMIRLPVNKDLLLSLSNQVCRWFCGSANSTWKQRCEYFGADWRLQSRRYGNVLRTIKAHFCFVSRTLRQVFLCPAAVKYFCTQCYAECPETYYVY